MTNWKRAFGVLVLGGAATVMATGLSAAVSASPPDLDQDTLEALRAEIPEGFAGEKDIVEGDGIFGNLVALIPTQDVDGSFTGGSSKLTGLCGGYAYSFDENGELLDAAMDLGDDGPPIDVLDGGQAFTSDNPFKVDTRGLVQYYGFSPRADDGPEDHTWFIKTSGISVDKGGDPNTNLKNRNAGIVDLDKDLPVKFSAVVQAKGEMTSKNQPPCVGEGYVEFIGNGLTDPVGLAGLALLGGGLFGLLFNARPAQTYRGSS
jgi:hypothetical protein